MRLILQHANVRATDQLDSWVEQCLRGLLPLVRIDEAHVRLEYRHEASPAYHASAHLVIPGPDVRVEAVDHTPRTALAKVMALLRLRATERAARRLQRPERQGRVRNLLRLGAARPA